ncbi:MAG TPA: hypothetical protein VH062_11865 [Polyangiaceae bacterium]|jgi:hypothetical protein|nr:hypothetical protein [Polyangiaceae bacterium]
MSDPERLLDDDGADPEVRELLRSLRDLRPEAGTATRSWGPMAARVAALPVLATATKAAATVSPVAEAAKVGGGGAWKALTFKLAAGALMTGLAGVGVVRITYPPRIPETTLAPPETPHVAPRTELPVPVAPVTAPVHEAPSDVVRAPSPVLRRSQLDEEASMLARARSALRRGDPHAAAVTLHRLQSAFPAGELAQEREVLSVEVLAANGDTAAAKRRAQAFIAAHPRSPHDAKLERFVEAP